MIKAKNYKSTCLPWLWAVIMLASAPSFSQQEVNLKKEKLADGIKMKIPENFAPMTRDDLANKYNAYREPIAAYTDESRQVDLLVNSAVNTWRAQDLDLLKDFYRSSFRRTFDQVEMLSDTIVNLNGKNYARLEFISTYYPANASRPIKRYYLMHYLILSRSVLIFTVQTPSHAYPRWQPIFREMFSTLKVRAK